MQNSIDHSVLDKHRPSYVADGRVYCGRFLLGVGICFATSIVLASVLAIAFYVDLYFIFLLPAAVAFFCGLVAFRCVKFSHCRNSMAAGLLGGSTALMAFFGGYHICMLGEVGFDQAHRVDALPAYVLSRWATDTVIVVKGAKMNGRVVQAKDSDPVYVFLNQPRNRFWANAVMTLTDGLIMATFAFSIAQIPSRRPYCAKHGCWMTNSTGEVMEGSGVGDVAETVQNLLSQRGARELTIHHCPSPMAGKDPCDVFLSAIWAAEGGVLENDDTVETVTLESHEIAEFAAYLPPSRLKFARQSEDNPWQAVLETVVDLRTESAPALSIDGHGRFAKVENVEPRYYGKYNTPFHCLLRNSIASLGLVGMLAGMAFTYGPLALRGSEFDKFATLTCFAGIGILSFSWIANDFLMSQKYRIMARLAKRHFPDRVHSGVDFTDRDLRFALIMPRRETSVFDGKQDFGILQVDEKTKELRFEGDMQRYRIPFESVSELAVERRVYMRNSKYQLNEYMVRLVFQTSDGPVERLLSQKHLGHKKDEPRRKAAQDLAEYLGSDADGSATRKEYLNNGCSHGSAEIHMR